MAVATANFQSTPDVNTILEDVSRLPYTDFEQLLSKLNHMAVQQKPPELPEREPELIRKIKYGLPLKVLKRSKYLSNKAEWETVTDEEHNELMGLLRQIEEFDVERLKCLIELAKMRGSSVDEVMKQLNVKPR